MIYRDWPHSLTPEVEVAAVELPGRWGRMKEAPFRRLEPLLDALAQAITALPSCELAFFGHSMGALIAFELARELRRKGGPQPQHLFVSGRPAPQLPQTDPVTFDLPEADFIREIHKLNGTPKEVMEHEELMELMIPVIRADFELIQTYEYHHEEPLECPISAYGGLEDSEVPRAELAQWKNQTSSGFALHMLPGDHFFLRSARNELLGLISAELGTASRRRSSSCSEALTIE